jgi:DTW domain-containing protein YfiP
MIFGAEKLSRPSKRPVKQVGSFDGRDTCLKCFRVTRLCLCSTITRFEIEPLLVLLVHPREFMKTIGTVRIVKLSVANSILWRGFGVNFDTDPEMNALLKDTTLYPMVLFPGEDSLNLTAADETLLREKLPAGKRLAIFVIDGTWTSAKQMIRTSVKLSSLPKLSFNVETQSTYEFRKQPQEFCLSTVEAVSVLVENLKQRGLCNPKPDNAHRQMLQGFAALVKSQVRLESMGKILPQLVK